MMNMMMTVDKQKEIKTMGQISRWMGNRKVSIQADPQPYDSDRAAEILSLQCNGNLADHMTDGEVLFTHNLWRTMPGYTCFYDAVVRIYQGTEPQRFKDQLEGK